ncbi:FlgD immunoglobulin-like domain containing protein [Candidatus Eisenbacteria bacterium]|uniref:FlgD immunoglobulin-like domain containing protein n=1 Tax=Eiseniibacteriota bacterium TaxID=2212470 RepID=A0ABV6YK27_UNCEI
MLRETFKWIIILNLFLALAVTSAMGEPQFRVELLPELSGSGSIAAGVISDTSETRVYGCSFDEDADTYLPVEWILYPEIEPEVNALPFIMMGYRSLARQGLDSWDPYLPEPVRLILGYSTEPSGARRAVVWKDDGEEVSLVLLPMLEGYSESDALGGWGRADPSYTTSFVAGWARDPQGFRKATVWEDINNGVLWDPQGLPDLGPGLESVARDVFVVQIEGPGTEITICYGSVFDEDGRELPAVWQSVGSDWVLDILNTLGPYVEGMVVADLPGLSDSPLCDPPDFMPDLIAWFNWEDMAGNLIWCLAVYRWDSDLGKHVFHHVLPETCDEPTFEVWDGSKPDGEMPRLVGQSYHGQLKPVATVWEPVEGETTNIYDLNDLVVNAPPWPLGSARSIDDTGRIVGIAREPGPGPGIPHAFIAIPMGTSGVETAELPGRPDRFQLRSSRNPFFERTSISYQVEESAPVLLRVHDILGREVARLADGWHQAGRHELNWDGRNQQGERLAAGAYWIHVQSGAAKESDEIVILR